MAVELPYFDEIIASLETSPESALARAFARHVHWGYFVEPDAADTSLSGFAAAAEAMTERVCSAAGVSNGMRILDVGCGFGGTIAYLNERLTDCSLVGVNIDERQIARAKERVAARSTNTMRFIAGDWSRLSAVVATQAKQWLDTGSGTLLDVTSPDNVLLSGRLTNGAVASVQFGSAIASTLFPTAATAAG